MRKAAFQITLVASLAMPAAASAQPIPPEPSNMTALQLQGVACILTGAATAAGAVFYSGTLVAAASALDWTIPLLVIPAAAGGYAVGCTVGSITGPGAHWLYLRYFATP